MTDGSSNLTPEMTEINERLFQHEDGTPMIYRTIQSGDPNAPNRADRRRALRKQRLKNNGERRGW